MLIKKKVTEDEHKSSTDRYLITYSDLITLLLGLFVILYATSQVDEAKYKEMTHAFVAYFKAEKETPLQSDNGLLKGHKGLLPEPIQPDLKKKSISEVNKEAESALKEYIDKGNISLTETENELKISFSEKLMFESARAEIQRDGYTALDSILKILVGLDYQISIDGHTDSAPIRSFRYESNWHLSVARALNVGYYLIQSGLSENKVVIRGFGSQRPIDDNSTDENRAKNRRVEIIIGDLPQDALSTKGYFANGANIYK